MPNILRVLAIVLLWLIVGSVVGPIIAEARTAGDTDTVWLIGIPFYAGLFFLSHRIWLFRR